jgi:Domain of unknown function (DUF4394)
VSARPVTGLAEGERLADIDFRLHPIGEPPPAPQLYGLGVVDGSAQDTIRLYAIDIVTATATAVAPGIDVIDGDRYGIDFNPTVDRVRVVNDGDENLRLNPNTGGLAGDDANLNPAGGKVSAVAYDRVDILVPPIVPNNTTAYAISLSSSTLVTLGDVNGQPQSANTGKILNAKPLGLALAATSAPGFDISPSGSAFATLEDASTGLPGVYTIDLNSGAATLAGTLPEALSSLAIVPQSALPPVVEAKDVSAPTILLQGVKRKMSFAAFLKGVAAKVTPSEPASLTGELLGAARKSRLAAFTRTLAKKSLLLAAGRRTLKLKPKKRRVGRPSRAFKVRLRITATDAAGNPGVVTRTIRVKPPNPPRAKASRAAASPGRR